MSSAKFTKLGIFTVLGCVLFSIGFGFTFYNNSITFNPNNLYYLSLENGYSANFTVNLNTDDQVAIYVSTFYEINITLTVYDGSGPLYTINSNQLIGIPLKISINNTDLYRFSINEIPPYKYSPLTLEIGILSIQPNYPLLLMGIPLIIMGSTLTFIGLKEINFLRKKIDIYYTFEKNELILLIFSLVTFSINLIILSIFFESLMLQNWLMIIFFVFSSIINIIFV